MSLFEPTQRDSAASPNCSIVAIARAPEFNHRYVENVPLRRMADESGGVRHPGEDAHQQHSARSQQHRAQHPVEPTVCSVPLGSVLIKGLMGCPIPPTQLPRIRDHHQSHVRADNHQRRRSVHIDRTTDDFRRCHRRMFATLHASLLSSLLPSVLPSLLPLPAAPTAHNQLASAGRSPTSRCGSLRATLSDHVLA